MEYTLTLNLEGDAAIASRLAELQAMISKLSSPAQLFQFPEFKEGSKKPYLFSDEFIKNIKESNKEIKEFHKYLDAGSEAPVEKKSKNPAPFQGPDIGGIKRSNYDAKRLRDDVNFKKDMSFLLMPLFNPLSMWATLFSTRQVFSALATTKEGEKFRENRLGGLGALKATAVLVGAATAMGVALSALTNTIKQTIAAYETARQFYSKSLMTGLGTNFTVRRSMLAEIMGVSEQDVFRFGSQMAYLNPKLEHAAKILAQTTVPLTKVSWEWKILGKNMDAMFAMIASKGEPAIMGFISALNKLVKYLEDKSSAIVAPFNEIARQNLNEAKVQAFQSFADKYGLMTSGTHVKGEDDIGKNKYALNLFKKGSETPDVRAMNLFQKEWARVNKEKQTEMPDTGKWMKQLPASSWEKMGLVIGGSSQNYAKETAKNTGEIAKGIRILVQKASGSAITKNWNMSPVTAQP